MAVQPSSSIKDYIKTKLFYVPTLQMIQHSIYASSLTIFLLLNHNLPIEDLIFYWAIISLVTQLPFTIYISILVRKNISFKLEWKKISKYLCSSLIFVLIWHFSNDFLNYNSSLIDFLPWLLFFIGICVLSYIILTFIIDSSARQFINSIINEIKKS